MPMVRPNPRQLSHAPTGELNENKLGFGSRYDRSHSAQCNWLEYRQVCFGAGGSESSTTWTLTRPCPTRSAASRDSRTRPRSAPPARKRSCTTSRVMSLAGGADFLREVFFAAFAGLVTVAAGVAVGSPKNLV